ncbi:MAG: ABC transporter substrate-binding protein [Desulfuromonadales bacterium]|nr:ABC transporter substrate-binding protein [Desulfuromonadales bacterium]
MGEYKMGKALHALLIVTLLWVFNLPRPAFAGAAFPLTVNDLKGRQVSLAAPAQRIVALRAALGTVCYMQLCDQVVGVEYLESRPSEWLGSVGRSYRLANPRLAELPIIGSRNQPDPERLLSVRPDVIFIGSGDARFADNLQQKTGIPVLFVDDGDLAHKRERFYQSLRLIGTVCEREQRAEQIIARIDQAVADLRRRVQDVSEKPSVYIGGMNFRVTHGLTGTSADYPPFLLLGINNIADSALTGENSVKGRFLIDPETLLHADPKTLFVCESGLEPTRQDLKKPIYRNLSAVENRRVFGIVPHYYAASPDTVLAETYYMGTVLFSEQFSDIDVPAMADDWYRFFVGQPLYAEMAHIFGGFGPIELD